MTDKGKNKGVAVTIAGITINLALGILYAWSIFKGEIKKSIEAGGPEAFRWDPTSINDPYAICCLVFAFSMILAGKCQDKLGPRITALVGGLLVSCGFILISQTTAYSAWIMGFGVLVGIGIGFGYSSATPPALKWFAPQKAGLIAGLVVSGFGLASVYIAPLGQYLLGAYGLQKAMLMFGLGFVIVVCSASLFLVNPPPQYKPPLPAMPEVSMAAVVAFESTFMGWFIDDQTGMGGSSKKTMIVGQDTRPSQMLKTLDFYLLWLIYLAGAGAGLMVIGSVAGMAKKSLGDYAFLAVAIMAVGNAGGRIIAGILTDKIGPAVTLFIMLLFQALLMFCAVPVVSAPKAEAVVIVVLATFIGFNYGANLSLFPLFTKTFWGLKNFGTNYGFLFTAWGVGGFIMSRLSEMLVVRSSGSYNSSFITAGIVLLAGAILTLTIKARITARLKTI